MQFYNKSTKNLNVLLNAFLIIIQLHYYKKISAITLPLATKLPIVHLIWNSCFIKPLRPLNEKKKEKCDQSNWWYRFRFWRLLKDICLKSFKPLKASNLYWTKSLLSSWNCNEDSDVKMQGRKWRRTRAKTLYQMILSYLKENRSLVS